MSGLGDDNPLPSILQRIWVIRLRGRSVGLKLGLHSAKTLELSEVHMSEMLGYEHIRRKEEICVGFICHCNHQNSNLV